MPVLDLEQLRGARMGRPLTKIEATTFLAVGTEPQGTEARVCASLNGIPSTNASLTFVLIFQPPPVRRKHVNGELFFRTAGFYKYFVMGFL